MTNTTIFSELISGYEAHAYTDQYIFGFDYKGTVYAVATDASVLPYFLKLDKASRGAGYALRFCPTTEQKLFLMAQGAEVICSTAFFKAEVTNSKYNNGEIFEKMVTEKCGQVWHKDNIPFTDDGDITVDGIAYQIKFQKATFCNEKSLANLK